MDGVPLMVSMRRRGSSSSLTTCSTSCCSRARWTDGSEVFFIALHTTQTKEQISEHDHCPYPTHNCEDAVESRHFFRLARELARGSPRRTASKLAGYTRPHATRSTAATRVPHLGQKVAVCGSGAWQIATGHLRRRSTGVGIITVGAVSRSTSRTRWARSCRVQRLRSLI